MSDEPWHMILTDRDYATACGLPGEQVRGSNRPELTTCRACIAAHAPCQQEQS